MSKLILPRRTFLRGLFAAPAIIAVDRLMPVKMFQSPELMIEIPWPFGVFSVERWCFESPNTELDYALMRAMTAEVCSLSDSSC